MTNYQIMIESLISAIINLKKENEKLKQELSHITKKYMDEKYETIDTPTNQIGMILTIDD